MRYLKKGIAFFLLLGFTQLFAQPSLGDAITDDFVLIQGGSDTTFCIADEFMPYSYNLFKTKKELDDHISFVSSQGGKLPTEYSISVKQVFDTYFSKTCVSVGEYQAFCKATGTKMPEPPAWGWATNKPMVNITHADAVKYCNWLQTEWGVPVRLPNEHEWAYASHGGRFIDELYWDVVATNIDELAAHRDNTTNKEPVCRTCKTPNALGIYNLGGNVWEYLDGTLGHGPVVIGGSINTPKEKMNAANVQELPDWTAMADDVGFRIMVRKDDVRKKDFLDKLNDIVRKAYVDNVPVRFTYTGIEAQGKTIPWEEVDKMLLQATGHTRSGHVVFKGTNGEIAFAYTEEQYDNITDLHVQFLAFYKLMLPTDD